MIQCHRAFPRRGEIYNANLEPVFGSEQGGQRPVLVIQNDVSNRYSPVVIVASMISAPPKGNYLTDVLLQQGVAARNGQSGVQLNQIRTIDKRRLERFVGRLNAAQMDQVDEALKISLGLVPVELPRSSN
jgi:mRNA interferase MazF